MNEDLLGNCRACGQIVSKNLVNGCPHCGEAEPHLTEEDERRIREEQEREVEESKEFRKRLQEQEEEKRKEIKASAEKYYQDLKNDEQNTIWTCGCVLVVCVILFFVVRACNDYEEKYDKRRLEEIERIETDRDF